MIVFSLFSLASEEVRQKRRSQIAIKYYVVASFVAVFLKTVVLPVLKPNFPCVGTWKWYSMLYGARVSYEKFI
jgi:uncharacterized membrane protein